MEEFEADLDTPGCPALEPFPLPVGAFEETDRSSLVVELCEVPVDIDLWDTEVREFSTWIIKGCRSASRFPDELVLADFRAGLLELPLLAPLNSGSLLVTAALDRLLR